MSTFSIPAWCVTFTISYERTRNRQLPFLYDLAHWVRHKFLGLEIGRSFEAAAYSRLNAYSIFTIFSEK